MKTSLEGQLAAPSLLEPVDRTLVNGLAELFEQLLVTVDHELFETASQNAMDPIQARLLMLLRDRGVQLERLSFGQAPACDPPAIDQLLQILGASLVAVARKFCL